MCPQALLQPAFWLGTLLKRSVEKITTAHPLTVTMSGPAEILTDFKHLLKKHGGGSVYNLCLHSHEYSSLALAVIFTQYKKAFVGFRYAELIVLYIISS